MKNTNVVMKWIVILSLILFSTVSVFADTDFTGGDLLDAANWTNGLPAGQVATINNTGFYNGVAQNTPWISGSTVTVGGGAVLGPLQADLSVFGGIMIVNDATLNCVDDVFVDGGTLILNAGSVTTCGDDWEANDHNGRIIVNGGTHSSGPDPGHNVGAQRPGCGIDFLGGTVSAGNFRFQVSTDYSIGGSAILNSASPTTTFSDYAGDINFISGWIGSWEVATFSGTAWKDLVTSGANITLDGTAIDSVRFDTKFMVSGDGKTLSYIVPEPVVFGALLLGLVFLRRR